MTAALGIAADAVPRSRPACVICYDDTARDVAIALARELELPFFDTTPAPNYVRLVHRDDALELHDLIVGAKLRVVFSAAELQRYRAGGRGANLLRRAIGSAGRHVVDATAGLGRDAVHLVALGYRVTAIERNTVVSALACDGLSRARAADLLAADNPRWCTGDARRILPTLAPPPASVYLDPMFPPKRKKSAAVRKEMRLLRALAGDDDDYLELFAAACTCATDRVVVKRPVDAPPIAAGRQAQYNGKLVRYDVYRGNRGS
jgi:16S rRNA (guanine1516-N2)-methyltransferase